MPCRWSSRARGYEISGGDVPAVEPVLWQPRFPVCVVFGHEVDGIRGDIFRAVRYARACPCWGPNVETAGGVVIYELLRGRHTINRARLIAAPGGKSRFRARPPRRNTRIVHPRSLVADTMLVIPPPLVGVSVEEMARRRISICARR